MLGRLSIMRFHTLQAVFLPLLLLLLLECGLEVRASRRGFETLLFGTDPCGMVGATPGYGPTLAWPYRSRIPVPEDKARRIWLASGSYLDDVHMNPAQNAASVLNELLGPELLIVNHSGAGWDAAHNTSEMLAAGEEALPDVAVLYQLTNDLTAISRGDASKGQRGVGGPGPGSRLSALIERTTIYAHLTTMLTTRLAAAAVLEDGLDDEHAARFEERLRAFVGACRSREVVPVLCTLARSCAGQDVHGLTPAERSNMLRYLRRLSPLGWLRTIDRWNAIIRRVAADEQLVLIDLDRSMTGRRELFRDLTHLSVLGHRTLAAHLESGLKPLLVPREEAAGGNR